MNAIKIESDDLKKMVTAIFEKLDTPSDEAEIVADVLVKAHLDGHDSHGISRVPMYVKGIREGLIVPGIKIKIIQETPACAHVDAQWGFGPVTARNIVELASKKAEKVGVGCISTFHSNDVARLGSYVSAPAKKGLICLMMVNDGGSNPAVAPYGGTTPFLSTNPIAAGIPTLTRNPILIDMATSVASIGKLKQAMNFKKPIPEGWLIDTDGNPTTDPNSFFNKPDHAAILPLGGFLNGHKGFALSLLVDILSGGLGGAGISAGREDIRGANGIFVLVIDPIFFGSREIFKKHIDDFIISLKNVRKVPGVNEILMPGERGLRERKKRLRDGIIIDNPTWEAVSQIADDLDVKIPAYQP